MNTLEIKTLATIADPETFWCFRFEMQSGFWYAHLTDCQPVKYATLGDIIHNDKIPRAALNAFMDLARAAGFNVPREAWGR